MSYRQHQLDIDGPLVQSPFYRAIMQSQGTVFVVDAQGKCFTRIWCIFEMSKSLINPNLPEDYTYVLYTAHDHTWLHPFTHVKEDRNAVGIGGAVAADVRTNRSGELATESFTNAREKHFPIGVLSCALTFECRQGEASCEEDRVKILADIGDSHAALDTMLHGLIATTMLRASLESEDSSEGVIDAFRNGRVKTVFLNLRDSSADTAENLELIVGALDVSSLEELTISAKKASGSWANALLQGFSKLRKLRLKDCYGLESLPDGVWERMHALEELDLEGCTGLYILFWLLLVVFCCHCCCCCCLC